MPPIADFIKFITAALVATGNTTEQFAKNKISPVIAEAAGAADEFARTNLGPALNKVVTEGAKALGDFSQEKLGHGLTSIFEDATNALKSFEEEHLHPALVLTGTALAALKEAQFEQCVAMALPTLNELGENKLIPGLYITAAALKENAAAKVASAGVAVAEYGEKLGPPLKVAAQWIQDNPGKTAVIVGAGLILVFPALVTTPAMWVVGFGSEGVMAGSAAALVHSYIGDVTAGGAFAIVQSAAAGGYGAVIVEGVAQAGSISVGAVNVLQIMAAGQSKSKLVKAKL